MRHQDEGSPKYRSWEEMSSGNRLLSSTGRVTSHVSTPGGSTYNQNRVWLKGSPNSVSRSTYGTVMAAKAAICPTGSGIGSRKS
jgi:hypothetical protein